MTIDTYVGGGIAAVCAVLAVAVPAARNWNGILNWFRRVGRVLLGAGWLSWRGL
jgi:type IV secretory pathway VirB2 component (pilin)